MLTPEDSLRLNVLLKQDLHALRIDEGKMLVHALTARGEARVVLNPNCSEEAYLRKVREVISSQVLAYPTAIPPISSAGPAWGTRAARVWRGC
jgi:hypothetical protein